MEIQKAIDGDIELVYPIDRIDTVTAKEFERYMLDVLNRSSKIIISFSKVNYVSSAGLRVILMSAKQIKAKGGIIALCDMASRIFDVFKMSGFDKILNIRSNLEGAKQSFS